MLRFRHPRCPVMDPGVTRTPPVATVRNYVAPLQLYVCPTTAFVPKPLTRRVYDLHTACLASAPSLPCMRLSICCSLYTLPHSSPCTRSSCAPAPPKQPSAPLARWWRVQRSCVVSIIQSRRAHPRGHLLMLLGRSEVHVLWNRQIHSPSHPELL